VAGTVGQLGQLGQFVLVTGGGNMPKFMRLNGKITKGSDILRGVWYASSVKCGYWTDDWDKLNIAKHGIPTCPHCGCPGMQCSAEKWLTVPIEYLKKHPFYDEWLRISKERCRSVENFSYEMWLFSNRN
jgi:hypothetical protein